jgi:hypothetical protein
MFGKGRRCGDGVDRFIRGTSSAEAADARKGRIVGKRGN